MRLVGEGYVSAEDLDKTIRDGLDLRWAFMGPFETIELNAPGGIPDYCARYGETLYRTLGRPVTAERVGQGERGACGRELGAGAVSEAILKKQRWRDDRIAALVAHKKAQPKAE